VRCPERGSHPASEVEESEVESSASLRSLFVPCASAEEATRRCGRKVRSRRANLVQKQALSGANYRNGQAAFPDNARNRTPSRAERCPLMAHVRRERANGQATFTDNARFPNRPPAGRRPLLAVSLPHPFARGACPEIARVRRERCERTSPFFGQLARGASRLLADGSRRQRAYLRLANRYSLHILRRRGPSSDGESGENVMKSAAARRLLVMPIA